jgi:hypothetical protein
LGTLRTPDARRINDEVRYWWRAVDHDGEVLVSVMLRSQPASLEWDDLRGLA